MANDLKLLEPMHVEGSLRIMDEGHLWMLVRRSTKPGKPAGVVYAVATDRAALWRYVSRTRMMGTGMSKEALMRDGWRAEKVVIAIRMKWRTGHASK